MRFLVTGTGRCGTTFASRYLRACGLDVRHEELGANGTSSWDLACGHKFFITTPLPQFDRVLHLVREPLACISSFTAHGVDHPVWKFISAHSPVDIGDPLLLRAMKHWHYWNLFAEGLSDMRVRVENWRFATIGSFFDLKTVPEEAATLPSNVNTWGGKFTNYSWEALKNADLGLALLIKRQALRYGYQ